MKGELEPAADSKERQLERYTEWFGVDKGTDSKKVGRVGRWCRGRQGGQVVWGQAGRVVQGRQAGRERVSADSSPLTTNIMEVTCFESRWKFLLVK